MAVKQDTRKCISHYFRRFNCSCQNDYATIKNRMVQKVRQGYQRIQSRELIWFYRIGKKLIVLSFSTQQHKNCQKSNTFAAVYRL